MQVKIWGLQALRPIEKGKRFIQRIELKKEIARLQEQERIIYRGNIHLPEIALTFDDGPDPQYTPQILDILQQYRVKATFFCIGHQVVSYPYIVKQEFEAGHIIGNHTWTHPDLALLSAAHIQAEIDRTSDALEKVIGVRPIFFRPPYGSLSSQVLAQSCHRGITTIMFNDIAQDWARPGTDFMLRRTLDLTCNGSIMLMHDGGGERSQTVKVLPIIIEKLQDRGFQFVAINQILDHLHKSPNHA
jgi:peptidoglycan/xylan/chitin deacetylase (PgdA/CDA1 family)